MKRIGFKASEEMSFENVDDGRTTHYANMPMHYTAILHGCKNNSFQMKTVMFFLFLPKTLIVGTR